MRKFVVNTDVFPTTTGFMIGEWDDGEANAWARNEFGLGDGEKLAPPRNQYGVCYACEHADIIWCENEPFDTQAIGTLIHEITHAVINIAKRLGFKLSVESAEFYCYMTGHLTEKALEKVADDKTKPKKKVARKTARKTTKKVDKGSTKR